jgi:hypothetical protein
VGLDSAKDLTKLTASHNDIQHSSGLQSLAENSNLRGLYIAGNPVTLRNAYVVRITNMVWRRCLGEVAAGLVYLSAPVPVVLLLLWVAVTAISALGWN